MEHAFCLWSYWVLKDLVITCGTSEKLSLLLPTSDFINSQMRGRKRKWALNRRTACGYGPSIAICPRAMQKNNKMGDPRESIHKEKEESVVGP